MKRLYILIPAALTMLSMTGCGPKYLTTSTIVNQKDNTVLVTGAGEGKEFGFINHASLLNNAIIYPLQLAAEKTLSSNKQYFSIVKPTEISNIDGVSVNTAKEYIDKCANNSFAKSLLVLSNPCRVAIGNLNYPSGGILHIKMYDDKDRPSDVFVYSANEVISYIKEQNLYAEPR